MHFSNVEQHYLQHDTSTNRMQTQCSFNNRVQWRTQTSPLKHILLNLKLEYNHTHCYRYCLYHAMSFFTWAVQSSGAGKETATVNKKNSTAALKLEKSTISIGCFVGCKHRLVLLQADQPTAVLITKSEGKWKVGGDHMALKTVWKVIYASHNASTLWALLFSTINTLCICTWITLASIQSQFKPCCIRRWSGKHDHIYITVRVVGTCSIPYALMCIFLCLGKTS